MGALLRVQVPS